MVEFNEVRAQSDNAQNVRKSLGALVFVAPVSAPVVDSVISPDGGLVEIPEEYIPLGMFSEDGLEFASEKEYEEVLAHGYRTYVRRDATTESHTLTVNALEIDRRVVTEMRYGIDLSDVTPGVNGEIKYSVPEESFDREWRLLAISRDINAQNGLDVFRGKMFHNVVVSSFPTETWSSDPLAASFEFVAKRGETGVVFDEMKGGQGLNAGALGFEA